MTHQRTYSRYTADAALLLGKQIRMGRKQRKWSEAELAQRAGISISTVKRAEKGDMTCAIGLVFELAALTGVTLFTEDNATPLKHTNDILALLPKAIRHPAQKVDDDF